MVSHPTGAKCGYVKRALLERGSLAGVLDGGTRSRTATAARRPAQ